MRLSHKTETELMSEKLLPEGDYVFEIIDGADETVVKDGPFKGKTYLKIVLKIFEENGNVRAVEDTIWDELKLIRVCNSIGEPGLLENETLHASSLIGGSGKLSLGIKVDKTEKYPPKNVVKFYKKAAIVNRVVNDPFIKEESMELDDEVPF